MKKVKFASCGRVFSEPFVEQPDYYKTVTYEDVFKEVKEDIGDFIGAVSPSSLLFINADGGFKNCV